MADQTTMPLGESLLRGENVSFFSANVGDVIEVCRPPGFPARVPDTSVEMEYTDYIRHGFEIMYPTMGRFIGTATENDLCLKYKHEKSGKQVIRYVATGSIKGTTVLYLIIQPMTIHDHASIYQGGPAYATYYADVHVEET